MEIKIAYFVTLLLYTAVVSRRFLFLLGMSNPTPRTRARFYVEARQLVDRHLYGRLPGLYYATLLSGILLVAFTFTNPNGILFLSSVVALLLLIADIILTLQKNSVHFSTLRNGAESYSSSHSVFSYSNALSIAGFLTLVCGFVFGL